jgi:hypothetical protein
MAVPAAGRCASLEKPMEKLEILPSPKLRGRLILGALAILLVWAVTLVPAVRTWNDPRADRFQLMPVLWASVTLLPLGLSALAGSVFGSGMGLRRARLHLLIAGGCLSLVALLEIFRRVSILMDG